MARTIRIGGLHIDFTAGDASFQRGSRRVQTALQKQKAAVRNLDRQMYALNRSFGRMAGGLFSLRGAFVALAGGGGIGLVVRRAAKLGAELVELSWKTGISVESLQGLQRAFQADGASIETVNKSLVQFLRRISEANFGLETYARAYRVLGVEINNADGSIRNQEDLLFDVADGLAGISSQADRANAAYNIFGRAGTSLLPVLQRGSEYLKQQIGHFQELGIVASKEAAALKSLEQAFTDISNITQTASAGAVAENAVIIQETLDKVIELAKGIRGTLSSAIAFLHRNFIQVLEAVKILFTYWLSHQRLSLIAAGFINVARTLGVVKAALWAVMGVAILVAKALAFLLVIEALFILGGALIKIINLISKLDLGWHDMATVAIDAVQWILEAFLNLPGKVLASLVGLVSGVSSLLGDIPSLIGAALTGGFGDALASTFSDATAKANLAAEQVSKTLKIKIPQISDLIIGKKDADDARKKAGKLGAGAAEAFGDAFREKMDIFFGEDAEPLATPFTDLAKEAPPALEEVEEAVNGLSTAANSMKSSFERAFESVLLDAESFSDTLKNLVRELARDVVRQLAINPLSALITSFATAGIQGAIGGGGTPAGPLPHPGQTRGDTTIINVGSGPNPLATEAAILTAIDAGGLGINPKSGRGRRVY